MEGPNYTFPPPSPNRARRAMLGLEGGVEGVCPLPSRAFKSRANWRNPVPIPIYKNMNYYSRFVVAHLIPRFARFNSAIPRCLKCVMFATTTKLSGGKKHSQNIGPVPITDHAHERWAERAATAGTDIETAWHQSIPVGAPERDADMARLYAPCDVLFVVRGGAVTPCARLTTGVSTPTASVRVRRVATLTRSSTATRPVGGATPSHRRSRWIVD